VRDLRRWSRAAAAREPLEPVELASVVGGAVSDLSELVRETGATVDVAELPVVLGDAVQLRQLFLNLVGNAIKFRRDGVAPRVRIGPETPPADVDGDPGPWCRVRVEDNGIGFDPEYADRIFGVFERLHGRERYGGTGMGLAIVRRIVERHGGKITATASPGQGARFRLDLRAG
jgi:signal transduction histidine kinase